jgi:predicted nucleic acid-binding protein
MLLDSNIIIYAWLPQYSGLRQWIHEHKTITVSAISYLETLGYHQLRPEEKEYLTHFFKYITVLPVTLPIIYCVTELRQQRKLSLGDALIAATALTHQFTLVTHNTEDFKWIEGIILFDPLS